MKCNINSKGKAIRLLGGIILVAVGAVLLFWDWRIAVAFMAGGGFMMFEGWSGWCVVRAMGFKTRI
jgi:hypothetical protein